MRRKIRVFVGNEAQPLGTIHHDADGNRESASFEYDTVWLSADDHFAIEPGLPLVRGAQFHRKHASGSVFHTAIADTEPDGWGRRVILRDYAKQRQAARRAEPKSERRLLTSLDFLLAVDDFSRPGALRFQDEEGVFQRASVTGRRTAPPLIELERLLSATRAVETNTESAADLAYLRGRGTSLGGARPKCTIIDAAGRLSIGKFPSISDERSITKGEVLAMRLASHAKLRVAEAELVESDGSAVALIRRFDRTANGQRHMYISAATLLGVEPSDSQEHAYTEIVDALRVHGAMAQQDIEELWRRMAFSILITNVDDHLLNHGFLHVEYGKWALAPAFDLNPFPDRERELKTWISEDAGPEASIAALMSVISYFRISLKAARKILEEVVRAVAGWRKMGRSLGMTKVELEQFADAFEHAERAVALKESTRA